MDKSNKQGIEVVTTANGENLVTDIYQKVEQLSLPAKAALAQYLISTNELTVVVSRQATVSDAIHNMDLIQLSNTLNKIAEQIRRLDQSSLDLGH